MFNFGGQEPNLAVSCDEQTLVTQAACEGSFNTYSISVEPGRTREGTLERLFRTLNINRDHEGGDQSLPRLPRECWDKGNYKKQLQREQQWDH